MYLWIMYQCNNVFALIHKALSATFTFGTRSRCIKYLVKWFKVVPYFLWLRWDVSKRRNSAVVVTVHIIDDHKTHFHLFSGAPEAQIPSQRHCQTLWRKIKQSFAKKSSRSSESRCADAETYKTFVTKNGGWWRDGRFW